MYSSQSPVRVFAPECSKRSPAAWSVSIAVVALVATLGSLLGVKCFQDYWWAMPSSSKYDNGISAVASREGHFLGRNYKLRVLEQQLMDKEAEIKDLLYQIGRVELQMKMQETNLGQAEAMAKALQEHSEYERSTRNKAQLSLAAKATELQSCQSKRDNLNAEVERCGNEIMELTQRRYGPSSRQ